MGIAEFGVEAPQELKYDRDNVTYVLIAEAKNGDGPYGVNINYSIKQLILSGIESAVVRRAKFEEDRIPKAA